MDAAPIIETDRLLLRELRLADKENLAEILSDPETMKYYPTPFSNRKVENWIKHNIDNYAIYHHGLWAVILKKENALIGDCGITMQNIEGRWLPEVGFHIHKKYWGNGYATEAARASLNYGFNILNYNTLIIYTKFDNYQAVRVAEKNGLKFVRHFHKIIMGEDVHEVLFQIDKLCFNHAR